MCEKVKTLTACCFLFSSLLWILPGRYFLTLLKRKCFETDNSATQLEMDMPPRQTPPSVQPPFNSPFQTVDLQADPSFMVEQWEDQKQSCLPSKQVPRFFPLLSSPQGRKKNKTKKHTVWTNITLQTKNSFKNFYSIQLCTS